jgi:hypothetical protein
VLVGRAAPGGGCVHDEDCAPGSTCMPAQDGCDQRCTTRVPRPPAKLGEVCDAPTSGACPDSTFCGRATTTAQQRICIALGDTGARCEDDLQCLPGFYCSFPQIAGPGQCRRIQQGAPCNGQAACPKVYSCVGAAPGVTGACLPGKRAGEACVIQGRDPDELRRSDCAYLHECMDLDGTGPRCFGGNRPGQPCGDVTGAGGTTFSLFCAEGFCDNVDNQLGVCSLPKAVGSTCIIDYQCRQPARCAQDRCTFRAPPQPPGSACSFGQGDEQCTSGYYCRPKNPAAPEVGPATCQPFVPAGQACDGELRAVRCDRLHSCVNGVCRRC